MLLLLVQALFFNVVVPSHTRGMIQLPGSKAVASCCAPKPGKSSPCDNKRTENCAICNLAARVTLPPVIEFAPKPTGLLEILPPVAREEFVAHDFVPTYLGRAPPACS